MALSANFTETAGADRTIFTQLIVLPARCSLDGATRRRRARRQHRYRSHPIHVDGGGTPVPNVSVRISESRSAMHQPSSQLRHHPGADPGSVLTDANGDATCFPVFGPVAGNGGHVAGRWSRSRAIRSERRQPTPGGAARVRPVHRHSVRRYAGHPRQTSGFERQQSEHQSRPDFRSARRSGHR